MLNVLNIISVDQCGLWTSGPVKLNTLLPKIKWINKKKRNGIKRNATELQLQLPTIFKC